MDLAFGLLSAQKEPVFSHGDLIHNKGALDLLQERGLTLWQGQTRGTVIIRAHGLPPTEREKLSKLGLNVCDATCPRVTKVQKLVAKESALGRSVIIWGSIDHPEVRGIVGHAQGPVAVIKDAAAAADLPPWSDVLLVAQTTQNSEGWAEVAKAVQDRWPEALLINTICEATENRQKEVLNLAQEVEALIVVGGKHSGNTKRLAELGQNAGLKTFLIENHQELDPAWFTDIKTVGVTAGASTPAWQISQVLQALAAISRRSPKASFLPRFWRTLVLSNNYGALGAAILGLLISQLCGFTAPAYFFSLFFFNVLAMHLIRDFTNEDFGKINDPDRAAFINKYRLQLKIYTAVVGLLGFWAAYLVGLKVLGLLLLIFILAIFYNLIPRPGPLSTLPGKLLFVRPFVKPFVISCAWAVTMVLPGFLAETPLVFFNKYNWAGPIFGFSFVFINIFILVTMMEVLGLQGDRILGRPTVPATLGIKTCRKILQTLLIVWGVLIASAVFFQLAPPIALLLIATGPLYNAFLLRPLFKNPGLYGYRFETLLYGQLFLNLIPVLLWP